MANCEFAGSVTVYIHKRGGEYHALIDPFSVLGVGRSEMAALREASELLGVHLIALSQAVKKHGASKVRYYTPLSEQEKSHARKVYKGTVVLMSKTVARAEDIPLKARPLTRRRIRELLPRISGGSSPRLAELQPVTA